MASTDPLRPAYLILGSDRPKVRRAVQRLVRRVTAESGSDINISTFQVEGTKDAAGKLVAVLEAAATPGFALGTRLLLVLGADHFAVKQRKELLAYIHDPMPGTCLALEGEKWAKDDALYKAVLKVGAVLPFDLPKKHEMAGWVLEHAKAHRLAMSHAVADFVLDYCGADPSHAERLAREIEKLAIYCGDEAASVAAIEAVCSPDDSARVFDLMDAVGKRNRAAGFKLLEAIWASGGPRDDANGVLYSLRRHIELLDQACALPHADATTAAKQLKIHPFTARKLMQQRDHFDGRRIGRSYRALAEAEAGLRGRAPATLETAAGVNHGDRLVMELALARLLA